MTAVAEVFTVDGEEGVTVALTSVKAGLSLFCSASDLMI